MSLCQLGAKNKMAGPDSQSAGITSLGAAIMSMVPAASEDTGSLNPHATAGVLSQVAAAQTAVMSALVESDSARPVDSNVTVPHGEAGAPRLAVVGALPWQQLFIPIGGGIGTVDDAQRMVAVPWCSLTGVASATIGSAGSPAQFAAGPVQLLAMPSGQLVASPASMSVGYGSLAIGCLQPLTIAHLSSQSVSQAMPVMMSDGNVCQMIYQVQPQGSLAGQVINASAGDTSFFTPAVATSKHSTTVGTPAHASTSDGTGVATHILNNLVRVVSAAATSTSQPANEHNQQQRGDKEVCMLEQEDHRPLPPIQTLAQHCASSAAALSAAAPTPLAQARLPRHASPVTAAVSSHGTSSAHAPAGQSFLPSTPFARVTGLKLASSPVAAADCQPSSTVPPCQDGSELHCAKVASTSSSCLSVVADGNDVCGVEEIREFARQFKLRRLSLGLTQTQVGEALSGAADGPAYSQSAICRFEKLDITPKSAHKIKPILEQWLQEAEQRRSQGDARPPTSAAAAIARLPVSPAIGAEPQLPAAAAIAAANEELGVSVAPARKRKRRTSFTPYAVDMLNDYFRSNTHPSGAEMTEIAAQLKYDREVVRVWFCNKRQALRNSSSHEHRVTRLLPAAHSRSRALSVPAVAPAAATAEEEDLSVCAVGSSTNFN